MYEDRRQWARLAYACLLLVVVWYLIQPEQLIQLANWQTFGNVWHGAALTQVVLFTIAAGLIFPKTKRLEIGKGGDMGDSMQFIIGMFVSAVAWFMSLL